MIYRKWRQVDCKVYEIKRQGGIFCILFVVNRNLDQWFIESDGKPI